MVADFDELMVVVGYLTLMPRHEDGLDVGKVLCTEWRARSRSLRQNSTSSPTRVRALD